MTLLIKEIVEDVQYISEDILNEDGEKTGGKNYFIEGVIMQGDIKNRNGRMYPASTLMKEMARYNKNYVEARRAYGIHDAEGTERQQEQWQDPLCMLL